MGFRQCTHARKIFQVNAHAERVGHLVFPHFPKNLFKVAGKIGKIKMTMGVDKHD
jgi:hypothetical protein